MSKRIFVGIPLSDEAQRGVRAIVKKLERKHWKVRWVREENWHLTLSFLGSVDDVAGVVRVVKDSCDNSHPFRLDLKGVSSFPLPKEKPYLKERVRGRIVHEERVWHGERFPKPKHIFVRVGGELEELQLLSRTIRSGLQREHIWFDEKPLVPHITLGRVRREAGAKERETMAKELSKLWRMEVPQSLLVKEVNVFESRKDGDGVVYDVVKSIQLTEK